MRNNRTSWKCAAAALAGAILMGLPARQAPAADEDRPGEKYLQAVRTFADIVLECGRDVYGPKHTPLFVDGLNVDTRQPVKWKTKDQEWILANLASQQNLLRTLDAAGKED